MLLPADRKALLIWCIKKSFFCYYRGTVDRNVPLYGKAIQIPIYELGQMIQCCNWGNWSVSPPLIPTLKKMNPCTLLMRAHGVRLINGSFIRFSSALLFYFPLQCILNLLCNTFTTLLWKLNSKFLSHCRGCPVCHDVDSEFVMFSGKGLETEWWYVVDLLLEYVSSGQMQVFCICD